MALTQVAWGMVGAGTTMIARTMTRRAMHDAHGSPRLPLAARRNLSFSMMVVLAGAAGVMLALGDVLREGRKQLTQTAAG